MIMLLNPAKRKGKRRKGKTFRRRGGWSCRLVKKCSRRGRHRGKTKSAPSYSSGGYMGFGLSPSDSHLGGSGGGSGPWIPKAANGGRRRRRRNPGFSYNRRRRSRNTGGGYHAVTSNPMLSGVVPSYLGAAFDTNLVKAALPVLGGVVGTRLATEYLAGASFLPSFLKGGIGGYVLSLLATGAIYLGTRKFAPKYARPILFGGAIYTMTQIINRYVLPKLGYSPMLTGFGDYLTVGDASRARPLMGMEDYLTVGDASRARPLMGMGDDEGLDGYGMGHMTTEEMAGLSNGGMSDQEAVSGEELGS